MGKRSKTKKSDKNSKAGGNGQQQPQQQQTRPVSSAPDNANENGEEYDIATLQQKLKAEISAQKKNLVDRLAREHNEVEIALLRMEITEKEARGV